MNFNLVFFLSLLFISIYEFEESDFYLKVSLIKLKAVGGIGIDQLEESAKGGSEGSSQEESSRQQSEESALNYNENKIAETSQAFSAKNSPAYISSGNVYYKKQVGVNMLAFNSRNEIIKFLLFESKARDLSSSFSDCVKVSNAYLTSKFTPNTSDQNEIIVNAKELLELLTKYIRTNGRCLEAFCVKKEAKITRASSGSTMDTDEENDSDTDSSVETNPKSPSRTFSDQLPDTVNTVSHHQLTVPLERTSVTSIAFSDGQSFRDSIEFKPHKQDQSVSTPNEFPKPKENQSVISSSNFNILQELSFREKSKGGKESKFVLEKWSTPDPRNVPSEQENAHIEYEETEEGDRVSQENLVPNLDLSTRSNISITEVEMELDLIDPWKSLVSMMLYEPVRRSSLKYDETHCNKLAKVTGRIIAFLIKLSCKLRLVLDDYKKKKCNERNKVTSLLVGCYTLKKQLRKYINYYSKFRYDLVDSIVGVTQCSLAKNSYISQINHAFSHFPTEGSRIRCTLKEYYLLLDFHIFLFYVIKAYNSAKEKLEKFISSSCTSICPTSCGRRPRICDCFEQSFNNIFADKINMESYRFNLYSRIKMCKNYLISNYLFSGNIPESAEYVSASGNRYKIGNISYIQTVQFPTVYPSNLEKYTVLKSNLFNLLLNPINSQEQPNPVPTAKESSIRTRNSGKKTKSRVKLKSLIRKNKDKDTNRSTNLNAQAHPDPSSNPQNNWL
ncbi:uncharacterized protein ELE39_001006 [Cryptosporidium sp. chipmunk genotype I]|uniref:uncharacterized protein n=1 Tax=Cryptosporidium sp. chipmunk genotype I TaxID=1280935 RepID=UPI00351A6E0E|nr:hypothetical protein ELE39_001006 [Cryptosporidium sp. chipmunk genotype I]